MVGRLHGYTSTDMTSLSVEKEKSDYSMENRGAGRNNSIHLGVSVQMVFKSLRLDEIIMGV